MFYPLTPRRCFWGYARFVLCLNFPLISLVSTIIGWLNYAIIAYSLSGICQEV